MTLRGVFYRTVSAGAVEKTELGYRAVGRRLLALRRDGRVPYSAITDGTRWITKPETHTSLDTMLADAAISYRRALWHDQDVDVHVFTEKDAISGVVLPVTEQWDVPLGVLRGYCSETFAHNVAAAIIAAGKPVFIYQLGDHDPSGLDAWRDFREKVDGFLRTDRERQGQRGSGSAAVFERLAVNEGQIAEMNLLTRPTKRSDTRARSFVGESVEVDAIPAPVLRQLISDAITQHLDVDTWALTERVESQERLLLQSIAEGGWSV